MEFFGMLVIAVLQRKIGAVVILGTTPCNP